MAHEDMPDMDAIARTMERIRGERDVLRAERDSLRRNFDFFKVETRFTTESLQSQLQAALATSAATNPPPLHRNTAHTARVAMVSVLVAQHLQTQQEADVLRISTLSQTVRKSEQRAENAERRMQERDRELRRVQTEDVEMRDSLTTAEVKLANMERKMADLTTLVSRLEQDLEQERADHEEAGSSLAHAEAQISDLSKTLDDSEARRNSLALQVSHLEQDLQTAKAEQDESESRYRVLQQQQLAAMSSNEATKALRRQIEDLEARIMRRTEQIGVHQHDIKKLDLNLRLQEERVAELTADNEVLETEKTAMVEDCRTTREERDAALRRCEELEENIEMLETGISDVETKRSSELQAMVGVVADSVAKRRAISHSLKMSTARHDAKDRHFVAQLQAAEEAGALTRSHAEHLSSEQNQAIASLRDTTLRLEASQRAESDAYTQSQDAVLALATVYAGLKESKHSLRLVHSARNSLHTQLDSVRQELEKKLNDISSLHAELEALRSRSAEESNSTQKLHAQQTGELQQRYDTLRQEHDDLESRHHDTMLELSRAQEQIKLHVSDSTDRVQEEDALRTELDNAQRKYRDEADRLRTELVKTTNELEAAHLKQSELESAHRQALDDISMAREELQQSLTEALEQLEASRKAEAELTETQHRNIAELDTLRERLEVATNNLQDITDARNSLLSEHGAVSKELDEKRAEADSLLRAKEDLEAQVEDSKTYHAAELKILEERLEDARKEKDELQSSLADVEVRLDETTKSRDELENQLVAANADVERLQVELKAESEQRTRDSKQHADDLRAAKEVSERAQLGHGELQDEIVSLRGQVRDLESSVNSVQDERDQLQGQITDLEAEIQRALSVKRHHESQIEEGHNQINVLQEQIERVRADCVHAEKEWKAAEINLSLQAVQHEKVVSNLRNELETLEEATKLEETVTELRERNEEMEELLKAKCLEIEENDDRFIELIKEKKKLTSKVESLTRKVKTLQEKLASGSQDSTPKANIASSSSRSPVASTSKHSPPAPPPTQPLPAPPMFQPTASTSRIRAATTPDPVARPKTPEARIPPTVFKARTPESRRRSSHKPAADPAPPKATFQPFQDAVQPSQESFASSSTAGKKRRAPDDFEDCESVPPQVFTAESVPSHDNPNTPRVRRALQSSRAGFTPVRHARPAPPQPSSPPRASGGASAALIADVTNSPRSKAAAKSKRGWLGTLRGGSSQASRSTSSSRPVFDRTQNAR